MRISSPRNTVIVAALPKTGLLFDTVLVLGFAGLTALAAQVSFWIGPVPVSGQTFAVLLAGALLGSRRGALSQLSYLAIGATGLPFWFAFGGPPGIARLIGPTGGYLFGFVLAAFVVGWLAERGWDRASWKAGLAMSAGAVAYFAIGLAWLTRFLEPGAALAAGLYPFIPGDIVKIILAALALPSCWRLLERYRPIS